MGKGIYPFTGKSRSVDVNFVDSVVIVIQCKDELHLFSIVGLGAVKQGQSSPQKLGAILVPPRKLGSGRVVWLPSAHIPNIFPILLPFCFVWVADGLTMLSKAFLDSSNFYASDSS